MKKVVFVFLSICCLIIGFCFIGCEKKSFEQPPYTVYALLKDSKGNEYELRVTGGVGETMFVCERQLTYQREEVGTVDIFIGELYDMDGKPLEEKFYQSAHTENSWSFPLTETEDYVFKKTYYMNRYNENGELYHAYTICFDVKIVVTHLPF